MTDLSFDERLTAVLHAYGETAVRPFDADAVAQGAMRGRRSPLAHLAARNTGRRLVLLVLAAVIVAVAVGVAVSVGSRRDAVPTMAPTQLPRATSSILSVDPTPAALPAFRGLATTSIDLPSDVFGMPVELPDGRVLLVGGRGSAFVDLDARTVERLPDGPLSGGTVVLHDGRILSTAAQCSTCSTSHVQVFDPLTNLLTELDEAPIGSSGAEAGCCELFNPAVAVLQDGRVLVVGGDAIIPEARSQPIKSAAIFDPHTDRFELLDAGMTTPLADARATTLADGRVLITGGRSQARMNALAPPEATHAQLFDPSTSTFTDLGPIPNIRGETVAARLDDGRVLIAEAADLFSDERQYSDDGSVDDGDAAVFDPTTEAFVRLPDFPRRLSAAIALGDGRVLVSSGWLSTTNSHGEPLKSPVLGAWTATYDPATSVLEDLRDAHPALRGLPLADGRALLLEHRDTDPNSAEWSVVVYD